LSFPMSARLMDVKTAQMARKRRRLIKRREWQREVFG